MRKIQTVLAVAILLVANAAFAQQVTKKDIPGISTFAQVETTIACGGATKPEAIRQNANKGFKSVIKPRLGREQGAPVEGGGAGGEGGGAGGGALSLSPPKTPPPPVD